MNKFNLEDIKYKFNKIVEYSQNLSGEANSDELFQDWLRNKTPYIDKWDGELIKELGEYTIHLDDEQRQNAIDNVIDQIRYIYQESSIGYPDFQFDELVEFINDNQENFFDNILKRDWYFDYKDKKKIPKGMKIVRAFKYFCKDKELLNEIQSVASMAIQNDKITGILCMSVHPLDYLSISENAHNWRSCHALDGEYRAGNLNYMADSSTVVCYLRSTHKAELPRFPKDIKWNSKKWRVLLFFDNEFNTMMVGRQYPFFENSLLLPIKREVERMFETKFSGWIDTYKYSDTLDSFLDEEGADTTYQIKYSKKYIPVGGRLISYNKFIQNNEGTLQFNDLLSSSTYTNPYYSFRLRQDYWNPSLFYNEQDSYHNFPKIRIGKACKCLECGKENIKMSESFLCKHCMIKEGQAFDRDEFGECYFCGEIFDLEEGEWIGDEFGTQQLCCPDCEKNALTCNCCGEKFYFDALKDGYCPNCIEDFNA